MRPQARDLLRQSAPRLLVAEQAQGQRLACLRQLGQHHEPRRIAWLARSFHHTQRGIDGRVVAHRDIKPENLFVMGAGARVASKVLDFGIAKVFEENDGSTHQQTGTAHQFRAFSPPYGAPEQFRPKRFAGTGPWTDVHALGLVLAELTAGRRPHEETDFGELLAVTSGPRPAPRTLGAGVSEAFEAACLRALEVDPRQRYQTAGELLEALRTQVTVLAAPPADSPRQVEPMAPPSAPPAAPPGSQEPQNATRPLTNADRLAIDRAFAGGAEEPPGSVGSPRGGQLGGGGHVRSWGGPLGGRWSLGGRSLGGEVVGVSVGSEADWRGLWLGPGRPLAQGARSRWAGVRAARPGKGTPSVRGPRPARSRRGEPASRLREADEGRCWPI